MKLIIQGYISDFSNKLIENGIITTIQSKYFKTQITIAVLFKGKQECLDFLMEKSLDIENSKLLCWEMFYGTSVVSNIDKFASQFKNKDFDIGSIVLLCFMKQVLHENRESFINFDILATVFKNKKSYFKQTLKRVTDCIEERFKIEEHLEVFGIKRNDIDGELRKVLDDLTEVYLYF